MENSILISNRQRKLKVTDELRGVIRRCIDKVLEIEDFPLPAQVSVTLVSSARTREINREFRQKDAPTDVLSFPMMEFDAKYRPLGRWDMDGQFAMLGDVVICLEQAERQAAEYGHGFSREVGYLTVHSMYHLLGYDHEKEGQKRQMRKKEEAALGELGITRDAEN